MREIELDDGDPMAMAFLGLVLSHGYRFGLKDGDHVSLMVTVGNHHRATFGAVAVTKTHLELVDWIDAPKRYRKR